MEVEKRGGVKGGFLQLFDRNFKSRKKLFSSKSESHEKSNLGKENDRGSCIGQAQLQKGIMSNPGGENGYHYAASSTTDPEYGTKPPGVVARLMGLESLPTSNGSESFFTPFLEPSYLMDAPVFPSDHEIVIFETVRNKLDGSSRNPLDMRSKKVSGRPIERFQTEGLPLKTSKPVSMSHHRLLSPIKSPGFIPPKNAAYIMEAAAKMIEQSPRSNGRGSVPSVGSSLAVRTRGLKAKMEAAGRSSRKLDASRKVKEPISNKIVKKQNSENFRNSKEKTNIRRRDGSNSISSQSSEKRKEHNDDDVKSNGSTRNVTIPHKRGEKQTSSRSVEALKLNKQRQNCASSDGNHIFESPSYHSKVKKEVNPSTGDVRGGTSRTIDKIVVSNGVTSRKMNIVAADSGKQLLSSSTKTSSGKEKLSVSGSVHIVGSGDRKNTRMKVEKSVKGNAFEADSGSCGIDKKKNIDVVSFTFTSPIKRPAIVPEGSAFHHSHSVASSSGISDISGDALSLLLEQKLRELTSNLILSQKDQSDLLSSTNSVKFMQRSDNVCIENQDVSNSSDEFSSVGRLWPKDEEGSKASSYVEQRYLTSQGSNSISSQPPFFGAASGSFEVDESFTEGRFSCLSYGSETRKSQVSEGDYEISDTASSISVGNLSEATTSCSYMMNPSDPSSNWELQYIRHILKDAHIFVDEFSLNQVHHIISPDLFHHLENRKQHLYKHTSEDQRKVLFDCVREWLEGKFRDGLVRSCRIWSKKRGMLKRRQWVCEEIYREIAGWRRVEEMMVDEVVDKDMSNGDGKWVDFEKEKFEESLEIEDGVVSSLVDELVQDLLMF